MPADSLAEGCRKKRWQGNSSVWKSTKRNSGFSLVEILLAVLIIGTLAAVLVPAVSAMLTKMRVNRACADIAIIGTKIDGYLLDHGCLPDALEDLGFVQSVDPWGHPYEYLAILGKDKKDVEGKWRKDRFLIPINSDFDLYSMGKDGLSQAPLTAKHSHDDVVRANNGEYIGLASGY